MNEPRYINANELKDTLDYYISEAGWTAAHNEALKWVRDEFIDAVKTADVAPVVHGHWVVEDLSVLETYTCSVYKHVTAYFGVKYCPECGAKMDESEDNNV